MRSITSRRLHTRVGGRVVGMMTQGAAVVAVSYPSVPELLSSTKVASSRAVASQTPAVSHTLPPPTHRHQTHAVASSNRSSAMASCICSLCMMVGSL